RNRPRLGTPGRREAREVPVTVGAEKATERTGADAGSPPEWLAALRRSLDRPLTSYHLVLGAGGLLLALGLVMVASASSVYAYQEYGDSYAIFKKQLVWVLVGLPLAFVASRLPVRLLRALAYPSLL